MLIMREAMHVYGKSLHLLLNFTVNLAPLFKKLTLLKNQKVGMMLIRGKSTCWPQCCEMPLLAGCLYLLPPVIHTIASV